MTTSIQVTTPEKLFYRFYPNNTGLLKFRVRANNDAVVCLTTNAKTENPMYEIGFGGWYNTKSIIRRNRTEPDKVKISTRDILDRSKYKRFWVKWKAGTISAGREDEETPLMEWTDPEPIQIAYIGVSTGWGSWGEWIIEWPQQSIKCLTPNIQNYKFYPNNTGLVKFRVRATNDAHICLTSVTNLDNPMYEIGIGGWNNTKSVIRRNRTQPDKVEAITHGILDELNYKGFWVKWVGKSISAGYEGQIKPFLQWLDPEPIPITFVGVSTGFGSDGSWIIEPPKYPYDEIVEIHNL